MALGFIVLVAFISVIFGALVGCRLSERRLDVRAKRQAEMQRTLNEQWQDLQAARRENCSAQMNESELSRV